MSALLACAQVRASVKVTEGFLKLGHDVLQFEVTLEKFVVAFFTKP
jgi:hypothetical protein